MYNFLCLQVHQSTAVRQKQIINAAQTVIIKYGSENVTIRRIAAEIGVSEGALYRHFRSKKDILTLLINDIGITLLNSISTKIPEPVTINSLEKAFSNHMNSIVKRRGVFFQVMAEIVSLGDKDLNTMVYSVIDQYIEHIAMLFELGVKAKVFKQNTDIKAAATIFFQ